MKTLVLIALVLCLVAVYAAPQCQQNQCQQNQQQPQDPEVIGKIFDVSYFKFETYMKMFVIYYLLQIPINILKTVNDLVQTIEKNKQKTN